MVFFLILLVSFVALFDLLLRAYTYLLKQPCIARCRNKVTAKWLYWNGSTRLFMEIYMNLALFSCVNLSHLDWDTNLPAVNFSNMFAILAMIAVISVPVALIVNALKNLGNLQSESY